MQTLKLANRKLMIPASAATLLLAISVGFNIPVLRQSTVFIYLMFMPGFAILGILKLKEISILDRFLFSAGLSIAFLMFIGLLINELYLVGFSQSLTTIPLTIGIGVSTLILICVGYRKNPQNLTLGHTNWIETKTLISKSLILVIPPVLAVAGALLGNTFLLMLLILVIAVLYGTCLLSRRVVPENLFPLLIFSIALALLFHVVFTSKFIIGFDANLEFYVFRLAQIQGHWSLLDPIVYTAQTVDYNAMLSITILPTIYNSMMNVSGETVFKLLYPFVFSLVPVALYRIFERQIGKLASLASALFFVSGLLVFYGVGPISLDRQIVAEFFFVLSVSILLNKSMSLGKRRVLLIIFGTALAVSHYSLMYIYLGFVFFIYAVNKFKGEKDKTLNGSMVMFLFVIATAWYLYSVSPLNSLSQFLSGFLSKFLADLLSPAARTTQTFLSQPVSNPINTVSLATFFIAQILVALGILKVIFKSKKTRIDPNYWTIVLLSAVLLALSFVLPNFAPSLNIDRFYAISLLFLAPCFVLGTYALIDISKSILQKISRKHFSTTKFEKTGTILLCIVLVSFFLTQTGFINRITQNTPLLRSLDLDRLKISNDTQLENSFYGSYLPNQDVSGAIWLQQHKPPSSIVFADYFTQVHVLTSYGLIPLQSMQSLTNSTFLTQNSFIYLGRLNTINGVINTFYGPINSSQVLPLLNDTDIIYSNGNVEIHYVASPR